MAGIRKQHSVNVNRSADDAWNYIVWQHWPLMAANFHTPNRDDKRRHLSYNYGRGSGRALAELEVKATGPATSALTGTWEVFDVGWLVMAAMGAKIQKTATELTESVKTGIEAMPANEVAQ